MPTAGESVRRGKKDHPSVEEKSPRLALRLMKILRRRLFRVECDSIHRTSGIPQVSNMDRELLELINR